jgi:hypothetical protein
MSNALYRKQTSPAYAPSAKGASPSLPGGKTAKASGNKSTGYKGAQTRVYPETSGHMGRFELR